MLGVVAENVFRKKDSPPSIERESDFRSPPLGSRLDVDSPGVAHERARLGADRFPRLEFEFQLCVRRFVGDIELHRGQSPARQ